MILLHPPVTFVFQITERWLSVSSFNIAVVVVGSEELDVIMVSSPPLAGVVTISPRAELLSPATSILSSLGNCVG